MKDKDQSRSNRDKIIHSFDESPTVKSKGDKKPSDFSEIMGKTKPPIVLFAVLALLGIATGYVLAQVGGASTVQVAGPNGKVSTTTAAKGQIFGSKDASFKDSAEGDLKAGGIDGEGAYHLDRPGGDSQTVYLTSSVIDLSTFVGKKVKVWGETNSAQKAGWLMDVGRLQIE